ncbi:uncharacterized protein LOC125672881 isoform X1 [Ostrea edulis]|uniref:uncharacterized protein LOC125672881 isoform X1 n=1 Tax=Ostrea edulis TaxID=37623 RepID=UPI0020957465|nr:uncharacterized protein LOC125672881 isoform X1 [Ostrea edulis]
MVFVGSPLTDVYLYMSVGYPVSYHSFDVTEKESTAEGTVKNKVEDHVGLAPKHGYCHARPKSHLVESILTFLCFPPTAIVAIFFALKVNRFYDVYEYAAAYKASKRARTFAFISFLLGLVMWILILTLWKVRFR